MNNSWKYAAICIASVILVSGCGQNGPTGSDSGASSPNEPKSGVQPLKIKGLSLGMDLAEARKICIPLLEGSLFELGEIQKDMHFNTIKPGCSSFAFIFAAQGMGGINADNAGKVSYMYFPGSLVNKIFNALEMEASDFAKKFAESYNIPELEISDDMQTLYYSSPDGFRIEIESDKSLTIKKVAAESEQKFD